MRALLVVGALLVVLAWALVVAYAASAAAPRSPAEVAARTQALMGGWLRKAGVPARVASVRCRRDGRAAYVCDVRVQPGGTFRYLVTVDGGALRWRALL